jgi:hypothetical protein
MKNQALIIAGLIFAIISLIHFIRLFYPFEVIVAGWLVPLWINVIGFLVTGLLSGLMFRALR